MLLVYEYIKSIHSTATYCMKYIKMVAAVKVVDVAEVVVVAEVAVVGEVVVVAEVAVVGEVVVVAEVAVVGEVVVVVVGEGFVVVVIVVLVVPVFGEVTEKQTKRLLYMCAFITLGVESTGVLWRGLGGRVWFWVPSDWASDKIVKENI